MSRELLVSCDSISKAYGSEPLFEGLSLGVFEGDRVGLIGPNASGKSTLVRILAGLEEPDQGSRAARKHLRIGYVAQDPVFGGDPTVGEVLGGALAQAGVAEGEREARFAVTLGRAGFADTDQAVRTLSGGWRKRLAILCIQQGQGRPAAQLLVRGGRRERARPRTRRVLRAPD